MGRLSLAITVFGFVTLGMTVSGQTFTTLYNFGAYPQDAAWPWDGVTLGSHGELYGVTSRGGQWNGGTVYELLPPASPGGAWTDKVLRSFETYISSLVYGYPMPLLIGPHGALYGLFFNGTANVAFQLEPPSGSSTWHYGVIYELPFDPYGPLALGAGQSLYGNRAAMNGDAGAVYSLTLPSIAGGGWTLNTLFTFPGTTNGDLGSANPSGALAVGAGGTLFGVTQNGGQTTKVCGGGSCGTVFSLTPQGMSGALWTENMLYAFDRRVGDGYSPWAGLVLGPAGVLYGTTEANVGAISGCGTVFSVTAPLGGPVTETVLHTFAGAPGDACNPYAAPVVAPNGVLYGVTLRGGQYDGGTVYELAPPATPGGKWTERVLHSFPGPGTTNAPSGIALAPDGTLYGAQINNQYGAVFAIKP